MTNEIDKALNKNKSKVGSPPKGGKSKNVDGYLASMKAFESDRVELAKSSEKTAWKVAAGFGALALISVIAVVLLTPLKTVELRVLRVDNTDGTVTVLPSMVDAETTTYGKVLDAHWARTFIRARNGYNWETIQNNFNTVSIMSNRIVEATYGTYIKGKKSPLKIFIDKKRIIIDIQEVIPLPSGDSNLAQIRFSRDIINTNGESTVGIDKTYWNATITFDYQKTIKTADERKLNPLGFRVTSYTEDRVNK